MGYIAGYFKRLLVEALGDDLVDVPGQLRALGNALQLVLHQCLPAAVVALPAAQRADQPRGHLRIDAVQLDHLVGQETVALAVGGVEAYRIAHAEAPDQRPYLVGVGKAEGGVLHQLSDFVQRVGQARAGLQAEPLVHDLGVVLPLRVESVERCLAFRPVVLHQGGECGQGVGHVVGGFNLFQATLAGLVVAGFRQVAQAQVFQRTLRHVCGVEPVGLAVIVAPVEGGEAVFQLLGERAPHEFPRRVDSVDIDGLALVGQVGFGGQGQRLGDQGRIQAGVFQCGAKRLHEGWFQIRRDTALQSGNQGQQRVDRQRLTGIPAIEGVRIVGEQKGQFLVAALNVEFNRRGEAAQQRHQRRLGDAGEVEHLAGLPQCQHAVVCAGSRFSFQGDRQRVAGGVEQGDLHRYVKGQLAGLAGCRRAGLFQGQRQALLAGIVGRCGLDHRCARLAVPAAELGQVDAVGVFHGLDEIVGGDGLAVVTVEVQVAAFAEAVRAAQAADHAHHFGSLVVDRDRVKIADFHVRVGSYRVRHRAGVLGELVAAQHVDIGDAFDRTRVQIRTEFLVAEHGEAFLEAQLEPVAAGDAVARPVMEIFVADDALDVVVVGIGGGFRAGQHAGRIENVQSLVFHRPHVEVVDSDDHEDVQVVLAPVGVLVPLHGLFERMQRVVALAVVFRLDIDFQRDFAARAGGEAVLLAIQVARDQRKQVTGLGEGVLPGDPVAPVAQFAAVHRVTVGQQHRIVLPVGHQRGGVARHDIGSIRKVGDAPETFGFALGAEHPARNIKSFQRGVTVRRDAGFDFDDCAVGGRGQHQLLVVQLVLVVAEQLSVHPDREQFQILAIEYQRFSGSLPRIVSYQ